MRHNVFDDEIASVRRLSLSLRIWQHSVAQTGISVRFRTKQRGLHERQIARVGGTRTLNADLRLVAATNRDLETEVKTGGTGTYRADLYYRLNVVTLNLPPLRERREDIELLTDHFVA